MNGFGSQRATGVADIEMTNRSDRPQASDTDAAIPIDNDIEGEAVETRPFLEAFDHDDDDDGVYEEPLSKQNHFDPFSQPRSLWRAYLTSRTKLIAICLSSVIGIVIVATLLFHRPRTQSSNSKAYVGPFWSNFSNIETYFAFGDSWTTTHFNSGGEQPSLSNPLGNPAFPGWTSSNGANYVGYLTATYNHSFIKTYDLAFAGSVIDATIDHPMLDWLDFLHQLRDEFTKYYTNNETGTPVPKGWSSETALFSLYFGINDVNTYDREHPQLEHMFEVYESLIGSLYNMSARNFIILNISPLDQAPISRYRTEEGKKQFGMDVVDFNRRIRELVQRLLKKYKDVTIFEYDVYELFQRVTDNPQSTVQTAGYKEVMHFCEEYKSRVEPMTEPTQEQVELCNGLRLEEYMWLDDLHVTWPVHDAMAAEIADLLMGTR